MDFFSEIKLKYLFDRKIRRLVGDIIYCAKDNIIDSLVNIKKYEDRLQVEFDKQKEVANEEGEQ